MAETLEKDPGVELRIQNVRNTLGDPWWDPKGYPWYSEGKANG